MDDSTQTILSVAELNGHARLLLENHFGTVWVQGELSNLARPASGHFYFTLKDKDAQVRCALFRMNRRHVDFSPENGQQVIAQARVSLYEGRGDYQLIISRMQLAGSGALQIAFEKLKKQLEQEGLFDSSHKKPLPPFPKQIGVITSASGAALQDILKVLKRRSPGIPIVIYPTLVQGNEAKAQIVDALETANARNECDVLILARGGGSLEDLWPFNEACVAKAVFNSSIPVVSGVGHEVDFTIADFVADHRAATPSAAAETVSFDQSALQLELQHNQQHMTRYINNYLQHLQNQLTHLQKRLRHPKDKLREQAQRLDQIEQTLTYAINTILQRKQEALSAQSHKLNTLSPLATLDRGYAMVTTKDDVVVSSVAQTHERQALNITLKDGVVSCVTE